MKDEASLHNESLHQDLMQLRDAMLGIVYEDKFVLRRAWRTLPPEHLMDDHFLKPSTIRECILSLLPEVKEQIEAAAEEVAQ